jgi:arylsulfatase A-like enzyme
MTHVNIRKNIILYLTDQWRWDMLIAPNHPARMPNLQVFRTEAMAYPNAFTTVPLYTPVRGSVFTGKLPHQNGTMDMFSLMVVMPAAGLRTRWPRLADGHSKSSNGPISPKASNCCHDAGSSRERWRG